MRLQVFCERTTLRDVALGQAMGPSGPVIVREKSVSRGYALSFHVRLAIMEIGHSHETYATNGLHGHWNAVRLRIMATLDTAVERADGDLERRTRIFLAQKNVSALRGITVFASDGTVKLRGRVCSFYEKQLCLNCCQHVAGVIQVIDEIEVEDRATQRPR